ncbi:hypothetical protein [Limnobacter parvus]|uniref:Transmembrane protein n=1 Tax=Limnobacter parvus TaxID=2939690 RepID=A0ABT1XF31_9BURK|nr:hypothetical protein [Limnobacter parvus]MCR2745882.1 hypothetical protein [Limnobacter parvus]
MNPISMPSRLNSIPNDLETQHLTPAQYQRSSAKNTALKVGATVLCGTALAAAMIMALKHQPVHDGDFQPMRMLASNETDPCAELNKNGGRYTPIDRPKSLRDATIGLIFFGSLTAPCILGGIVGEIQRRLGNEEDGAIRTSCCCCAAFPMIGFVVAINLYTKFKGMTDGQCWDSSDGWEGSRG